MNDPAYIHHYIVKPLVGLQNSPSTETEWQSMQRHRDAVESVKEFGWCFVCAASGALGVLALQAFWSAL